MKTKIIWLISGFVAAFIFLHAKSAYYQMPRDHTELLSEKKVESLNEAGLGFLKNSYGFQVGDAYIYTPYEESNIIAYIMVGSKVEPSQIILYDNNKDGKIDWIGHLDKKLHNLTMYDNNNDGIWDQWMFSKKPNEGRSYADTDLDGQPDLSENGKDDVLVFVQNGWRKYIKKNGKKFAEVDGEQIEIKVNKNEAGVWQIISPNKAL